MDNSYSDNTIHHGGIPSSSSNVYAKVHHTAGKSNLCMLIFNFSNCIIGSGIISLPYSLGNSGLGLGSVLITFSAFLTAYTLMLLIKEAKDTDTYDYKTLVQSRLGTIPMHLLAFCHATFPLFICMSYGIAIADNLETCFRFLVPSVTLLQNRQLILTSVCFFVLLPLSNLKSVALLEKVSALSILCCLFYTCVFFTRSLTLPRKTMTPPDAYNFARRGVAQAFSAFYFAMTPHHNLFQLYTSLERNTVRRFSIATHTTIGFSLIVYFIVSVSGYVTFGGTIQGNLLNEYCDHDIAATVARLVFAVSILLTYPLQIISSRDIILSYFCPKGQKIQRWQHCVASTTLLCFCITIAITTRAFGVVVEIGGALTAAPMATIVPAVLFIKGASYSRGNIPQKATGWIIMLIGVAGLIFGTSTTTIGLMRAGNSIRIPKHWCDESLLL